MATSGKRQGTAADPRSYNQFSVLSNLNGNFPSLNSSPPRKSKRPSQSNERFFEIIDESIYVIIKRTEAGHPKMSELSVFGVQKAIETICGSDVAKTSVLKDGSLLVQTKSKKQADQLLKNKTFCGLTTVNVTEHEYLNSSKGFVVCEAFENLTTDEIVNGLKQYKVIKAEKQKTKKNDIWVDSSTVILTFKSNSFPSKIKIGYLSANVRQYVPNPMRCSKCYKYGHTKKYCKNEMETCRDCGENKSQEHVCVEIKCTNCKEKHPATSRDCPRYKEEHQIQKIRTVERISYGEARRKLKETQPQFTFTYADQMKINTNLNQKTCSCKCNCTNKNIKPKENINTQDKEDNNTQNTNIQTELTQNPTTKQQEQINTQQQTNTPHQSNNQQQTNKTPLSPTSKMILDDEIEMEIIRAIEKNDKKLKINSIQQ